MSKQLTQEEFEAEVAELLPRERALMETWLERGDGVAVYQNVALDSSKLGHKQYCSYGSPAAMLEVEEPPKRMPDIGSAINWPYQLKGTYRRST